MTMVVAHQAVQSVKISAVVTRCGCTNYQKHGKKWHGKLGKPCPQPRLVEDRGVIAEWHRNPWRRAVRAVQRLFGKV